MSLFHGLGLGFLGLAVGTFGTLIGAGGGFILMPIFFFLYPDTPAQNLTAVSLAVVFCNALSGSFAYARARRIDTKSALIFAAAATPGALVGARTTESLPRAVFDPLFGALLITAGTYLLLKPLGSKGAAKAEGGAPSWAGAPKDKLVKGGVLSIGVGFVSSLLGIGGGIIHVPAMVHWLAYPVHVATATSHLTLAIMVFFGAATHILAGDLAWGWDKVAVLAPTVVIGAQLGARLSAKVRSQWILRGLAAALASVGVRLLLQAAA